MKISPAHRIQGIVRLSGDKSISHRAALVAALANGESHISNFSTSQDCASTLACLRGLGVAIEREGNDVCVAANGSFRAPTDSLDCGNSGSTIRFLTGILAGQNFGATLTGDNSLQSRPMKRIIEPLEMMGARVFSQQGRPPLRIEGQRPLKPISYELPVASAQVKTCLLLAGLFAEGRTEVRERLGTTRDHTERMLQWFSAPIEIVQTNEKQSSTACAVVGPASLTAHDVRIPGDFSSAAFFIAAAALLPGSELEIAAVGLNPTRTQFLETLRSLGASFAITEAREDCNEPLGTIRIQGTHSFEEPQGGSTTTIEGQVAARLIDELPLLAVVGTQAPRGIIIRDAQELRFKETDRITATVKNLRAMGAEVEEYQDGLAISKPARLRGARLHSYGDHRIAMAFSVAALLADSNSEMFGSECVAISFPEFFDRLESVVER